ncbi:hypothetical protein PR048_025871 [Dryococelus australis]|uniref:Uncharacterized protein n=1 Tax=Dryococelus australis TaxID=614101 RepID=A0ABQ9GJT6_9NEOP|nr:hypothetical protein PR048_025871 [Dryococelus australis]
MIVAQHALSPCHGVILLTVKGTTERVKGSLALVTNLPSTVAPQADQSCSQKCLGLEQITNFRKRVDVNPRAISRFKFEQGSSRINYFTYNDSTVRFIDYWVLPPDLRANPGTLGLSFDVFLDDSPLRLAHAPYCIREFDFRLARINNTCAAVRHDPGSLERLRQSMMKSCPACIAAHGGQFEHRRRCCRCTSITTRPVCGPDGVWSRGWIRGNPGPWSVAAGVAKRGAAERIPVGELSRSGQNSSTCEKFENSCQQVAASLRERKRERDGERKPERKQARIMYRQQARAAVAERLDCSPPTKANRFQSPAGPLPDFCKWKLCRTMPMNSGFSRWSPFLLILALRHLSILPSFHHLRL